MEVFSIIILFLLFLLYFYYKKSFRYWEKKGVATINPTIPFGNLGNPFKAKIEDMVRIYEKFKSMNVKYGGIYAGTTPILIPIHPEAVKTILIQEFQHFNSHGNLFLDENDPLLVCMLFNLNGDKWRDMRVKLTPNFTSGKIKLMFQTMLDCGEELEKFVFQYYGNGKALDITETFACYITDVIGSCAFGLECNSFKNPNAEFCKNGKRFFEPNLKFHIRKILNLPPRIAKLLKIRLIPKDLMDFFFNVLQDVINYRESHNITRNDFMQIVLNSQKSAKIEGKPFMTTKEIIAQICAFFLAGFETSSTTATFCLYELIHHQDVQNKLRNEILQVIEKNDGKLTYDGIMEMKYLDQVFNETLRKYPPVHTLPRKCIETCTLPNGIVIEKNTTVLINVLGMHKDKEYFPDPDKFDPDRFSDKNKQNILPFTYLPFGEGPRLCIGQRFGLLQAKVAISVLLRSFKIFPHSSVKYPMEFDGNANSMLAGKDPVMITIQKN